MQLQLYNNAQPFVCAYIYIHNIEYTEIHYNIINNIHTYLFIRATLLFLVVLPIFVHTFKFCFIFSHKVTES